MTSKTTYLLGILATIVIGTFLFKNLCVGCMNSDAKSPTDIQMAKPNQLSASYPFAVRDSDFPFQVNHNFNFIVSSPSFLMPMSMGLKTNIEHLKSHLDDHPNQTVRLTGYYTSEEENTSSFANLGIARAHSVKNHLVLLGVPSDQIIPAASLDENLVQDRTTYLGAISYELTETKDIEHQP